MFQGACIRRALPGRTRLLPSACQSCNQCAASLWLPCLLGGGYHKIAHRRALAIFTADEASAGNSAARTIFTHFLRRRNRGSLAIFFAEEIAHLGASKNRDFSGSDKNRRRSRRESLDFGALRGGITNAGVAWGCVFFCLFLHIVSRCVCVCVRGHLSCHNHLQAKGTPRTPKFAQVSAAIWIKNVSMQHPFNNYSSFQP